jgi:hypothetical protein
MMPDWFVASWLAYIVGAAVTSLSMNYMQKGRITPEHLPLLVIFIALGLTNFIGGLIVALLRDAH